MSWSVSRLLAETPVRALARSSTWAVLEFFMDNTCRTNSSSSSKPMDPSVLASMREKASKKFLSYFFSTCCLNSDETASTSCNAFLSSMAKTLPTGEVLMSSCLLASRRRPETEAKKYFSALAV